ncbi:MAG: hypothetical protein LBM66_04320 [Bifidobacteriaceae bacterium]|jgi:hypothetical protein|nr:hypothetical protein [Bifidobacteriaceae bacterium]
MSAASANGARSFVEAVIGSYARAFGARPRVITDRNGPEWGGLVPAKPDRAFKPKAVMLAFVTPSWLGMKDRVSEALAFSGTVLGDDRAALIPVVWERLDDDPGGPVPVGEVDPGSARYRETIEDAAWALHRMWEARAAAGGPQAAWLREAVPDGLVDRPDQDQDTLSLDLAMAVKMYARRASRVAEAAAVLDQADAAIFDGVELVGGTEWTGRRLSTEALPEEENRERVSATLAPAVEANRAACARLSRQWRKARRALREARRLAAVAQNQAVLERLEEMVGNLAATLNVKIDAATEIEAEQGADGDGPLSPAFRALLRAARTRQEVRVSALGTIAAAHEEPVPPRVAQFMPL